MIFNGMPVFTSDLIETRTKIPARPHRKKRIFKKWLKRYGYKYIGTPGVLILDNNGSKQIWCHPAVLVQLQRHTEYADRLTRVRTFGFPTCFGF